jgi:hypothetical protein
MGWTTGVQFPARVNMGLFLFSTASRQSMGPTQPLIQWVQEAKQPGREADHSLPCSVQVKNAGSYTSTPTICLHDVVIG